MNFFYSFISKFYYKKRLWGCERGLCIKFCPKALWCLGSVLSFVFRWTSGGLNTPFLHRQSSSSSFSFFSSSSFISLSQKNQPFSFQAPDRLKPLYWPRNVVAWYWLRPRSHYPLFSLLVPGSPFLTRYTARSSCFSSLSVGTPLFKQFWELASKSRLLFAQQRGNPRLFCPRKEDKS